MGNRGSTSFTHSAFLYDTGGMGLWLVAQTCDALSLRTRDGVTYARFALRR